MHNDDATLQAGPESEYLWLRDGALPRSREDRFAEALALVALLFSLGIGVVIAMLPVSATATPQSLDAPRPHVITARDAA